MGARAERRQAAGHRRRGLVSEFVDMMVDYVDRGQSVAQATVLLQGHVSIQVRKNRQEAEEYRMAYNEACRIIRERDKARRRSPVAV